jgi:hypothetical protein
MKLQVNPHPRQNQQVSDFGGVQVSQAGLLPGARKTWATSTSGRLVLEDTYKV